MSTTTLLYNTNDAFVIEQASQDATSQHFLTIHKQTSTVSFNSPTASLQKSSGKSIYGIFGSIQLTRYQYLAVVTEAELIGPLFENHLVYRVESVEWLPFKGTKANDDDESDDDVRYLELLKSIVETKNFYFSYTYDLTRSVQNWIKTPVTFAESANHLDQSFMWNHFLIQQLNTHCSSTDDSQQELNRFLLPVIRGFIEIQNCKLSAVVASEENKTRTFQLSIVSRLGVKRVGTRYNIRGLDSEGNVANYAETEQIVQTDNGKVLSFMQLRGSIPLYWTQKTNLKYQPKIKISDKRDSSLGFKLHFEQQLARYKDVVIVNLVKLKGSEKLLADAYETETKKYGNNNLKYISFDFHNRCKSMNFSAINELVQEIEQGIHDHGYFQYDIQSKTVEREQTGIVRVNCIDCLDRTNVVESVFARHVLTKQLRNLEYITQEDEIAKHAHLESIFKNAWADNGDALSNMYAGTGALKADFTRTGKRSLFGLYNDGMNSVTRYYLNNFLDGSKQDAINLFLGKYKVNPQEPSPFRNSNPPVVSLLKYALFASLFMIALSRQE